MLDNPAVRLPISIFLGGLLIALILHFMPVYPMPQKIIDGLNWLFDTLWSFNFMLPVKSLVRIFGLIILTDVVFGTVKIILFLKNQFTKTV